MNPISYRDHGQGALQARFEGQHDPASSLLTGRLPLIVTHFKDDSLDLVLPGGRTTARIMNSGKDR